MFLDVRRKFLSLLGISLLQSGCQGGGRVGEGGLGGWGEQMQTIIYRVDKQQGPTV